MGFLPLHKKLYSLKSLTALFELQTCGLVCSALALFLQSLVLQLVEGYFWQSLSCPFPCTLPLAAAAIVPAVSEYLGRPWRNLISELCTQITCYSSLMKCNYPSSVVSSALLSVRSVCLFCAEQEQDTPLRLSYQPTEMADVMEALSLPLLSA